MSKWTLLLGILVASLFLYKIHIQEVTFVDVLRYVVVKNVEEPKLKPKLVPRNIPIPTEIPADQPLSIMAFGDIMLGRYVRVMMDQNGTDYPFRQISNPAKLFTEGANVVFGNLEGPILGQGSKGGTSMVFSFNEDVAPLLKNFGFTMLSIANNHALDQGQAGRQNTISTLKNAGLGWCGNSNSVDPASVYYNTFGRKNFAFICFHSAISYLDLNAAVDLIKEVRRNVDYLVVSNHWGIEYKHSANYESQIKPGRAFIDAGADLVIGHHPHVVQNFEVYNGKLIIYSLGNFIFDQYWSQDTQEELAAGIILNRSASDNVLHTKVYLFPMRSDKSQPRMMNEEERTKWIEKFIGYGSYDELMQQEIRNGIIEIP
jgi:poly-gamma-glutamate synthesis protein (capsule biosynthesis protein)